MIRVAHLLPNMAAGGRERIVADLCAASARHGIAPHLICYDPPVPGAAQIASDAPTTVLDRSHAGFGQALQACLRHERIDLLHAQGHVSAALARGHTHAIPMVATLHVALGSGWRWALPVGRGLRAAHCVTAVSDDLARRFAWLSRQPIETIPTGVDLTRFRPAERRPDERAFTIDRPFTIGIAARLHPVKRHEDAFTALRLLRDEGLGCRLRIAGEGPRGAELARLATGLDIEFCGAVTDMPAWLNTLDAFALVSDHEGTPAALLEAMACGLPCIATAVGGVPALTGDAAMLIPRRAPRHLANAVKQLMNNVHLRHMLAESAKIRAASHSAEAQAGRYADVYRQVLAT